MTSSLFSQGISVKTKKEIKSSSSVSLNASECENVRHGGYLTIKYKKNKSPDHFINLTTGKQIPLMRGIAKGAENKKGTFYPEKSSGIMSYVLTQTDVSNIKNDGLVILAEGYSIKSVSFETPPAPVIQEKKVEVPTEKFAAKPSPVFKDGTPFAEYGKMKVNILNVVESRLWASRNKFDIIKKSYVIIALILNKQELLLCFITMD